MSVIEACPCVFCGEDTPGSIRFQHHVPAPPEMAVDDTVYTYAVCGKCYELVAPFVLFPLNFVLKRGLFEPPKPKE